MSGTPEAKKAKNIDMAATLEERWAPLQTLMGRSTKFGMETGPLTFVDGMAFEPDPEVQDSIGEAKVLCVGAGGLGCEILKNLALTGFKDVHVIDMDTIDVTNLNRQFLFRKGDVGEPKCTVAAAFVNKRVPGCNVTAHFGKLQDFADAKAMVDGKVVPWYKQFNVVVAGLDNIEARRWLNATLCGLVTYEADGSVDVTSVIPLIDGGTEGFKGQARVILPMKTSCFECTMNMFPPAQTKAVCTLENNPRQPSDCAIYVFMKIDDTDNEEEAEAAGTGASESRVFSQNEQVAVLLDTGSPQAPVVGTVLRNESGGIADEPSTSAGAAAAASPNAMVDDAGGCSKSNGGKGGGGGAAAEVTFTVKLAGDEVRTGIPASCLRNIRQEWVGDFGPDAKVDKDSRVHMMWIHQRAEARAKLFKIEGLTYEKTLGAVKNIIPAVASTNAVIAAACVHEAYKCLTFSGQLCNTYMLYNGQSMNEVVGGTDVATLKFERDPECLHCQDTKEKAVTVSKGVTVREFVQQFVFAPGALDLSTVVEGTSLPPPLEPMVYDSEGLCFYCTTGALAALKAGNTDKPLGEFLDDGEVCSLTDSTWGKNVKRSLRVNFA